MGVKLIWIKVVIVVSEVQPTLLLVAEQLGIVKLDDPDNVTYICSVLVCFEMAVLGFLQFCVFPVSNFKVSHGGWVELVDQDTSKRSD